MRVNEGLQTDEAGDEKNLFFKKKKKKDSLDRSVGSLMVFPSLYL